MTVTSRGWNLTPEKLKEEVEMSDPACEEIQTDRNTCINAQHYNKEVLNMLISCSAR